VQGPTFLIEYDNTQNNGNHIHSVWRDFNGDFGRDILREHLKVHPGAATQMHRLATTLPHLPALSQIADALAKGAISETQAAVITTAIQAITAEATPEQQTQAAALLLSQAAVLAPKELALCGNRILHHVAPQRAEQRDRAHLEAAERSAWQARAFTLSPDGHGRYRLRGSTTAEGAALLHTILDPLTHPRRHRPDDSDHNGQAQTATADTNTADTNTADTNTANDPLANNGDTHDGNTHDGNTHDDSPTSDRKGEPHKPSSDPGSATAAAGAANAGGRPGQPNAFRDPRSAPQRRHDALLDALRLLLAADTLPDNGGSRPQLALTVGFDLMTRQLGGGWLDTGAALSAAEARKLACDAGIFPAVLDGHSVPLDLGRERRLITGALRKALILRDRGCAWPGCDRPPRWCAAHHLIHWSQGGETCLANSVLVCTAHHGMLHHDDGWTVFLGADGHPWFTPPAHLDPQQTPRRNLYHQRN